MEQPTSHDGGGGGGTGGSSSSVSRVHRVKAKLTRLLETASLDITSGSWSPPQAPPPPPPPPPVQTTLISMSSSLEDPQERIVSNKPPPLTLRSITLAECPPIEDSVGLLDRLGHKFKERSDRVQKVI